MYNGGLSGVVLAYKQGRVLRNPVILPICTIAFYKENLIVLIATELSVILDLQALQIHDNII